VTHRDAVVDGNRVELNAPTPRSIDNLLNLLPDFMKVHVTGYELGEAIGDGNDGLAKIRVSHPGCTPKRSRARHIATRCGGVASIPCHDGGGISAFLARWLQACCPVCPSFATVSVEIGCPDNVRGYGESPVRSRRVGKTLVFGAILIG